MAAATHSLVESANALVQGHSSEEKLISAAKQVASSTAQLLVACKVKADPDSASTQRLQAAGNAVKRATDNLVRAAQQAIADEEERSLVVNKKMVGGIAQEINARSEVLRIERELEDARNRLAAIRRAKYRGEGDSDADGYMSGYDSSMETSGYRTNLNGSDMERNPYASPSVHVPQATYSAPAAPILTQESTPKVRQVIQAQQQMAQQLSPRSESPVNPVKKQPPATPPRQSSVATAKTTQESPLLLLQRQRQLLETTTNNLNNSSIEDHTPSFSESRQRFNNSSSSASSFSTSMSSFQSPGTVQQRVVATSSGEPTYYSATVRNVEQIQRSHVTTEHTEKSMTMTSSSKVYTLEEK